MALEPAFARAHSGIANTYVLMNFYGGSPDGNVWPRAKAAAERALALDSGLAEAHAALAHVKYSYEWDWAGAETEFKRALELDGNDATAHQWYAEYLSLLGRTPEAVREIERALALDPQSLIINAEQGVPYAQARQCARAEELFLKALEMEPAFPATQYYLARCYQQDRRDNEAIALYQTLESKFGQSPTFTGSLAHAYAVSAKPGESRRLLANMETASQSHAGWHYMIATVYAGLGEKDRAFEWLDRALSARDDQLVLLKTDTHLDPLRGDRRFAVVLARVGIP
ncbi:MAG: tetratricopeptide repeat protein [Cyanobacteria bacterium]|nr:tetratricopeptide repeat protein [Cyanobacteriota bacterium]